MSEHPTDARALASRLRIIQTYLELVEELNSDDIPYKVIARRAGVGERTVFRHFPSRSKLSHAGVAFLLETAFATTQVASIFDLPVTIRRQALAFEEHPEFAHLVAEELVGQPVGTRRRDLEELVLSEITTCERSKARRVAAGVTHLESALAWNVLHDELGLPADDCADALSWSMEVAVDQLRKADTY